MLDYERILFYFRVDELMDDPLLNNCIQYEKNCFSFAGNVFFHDIVCT